MESLMIAVGVVMPMAIMVGIGMLLRTWKVTNETVMKNVDSMIFKLFMPAMSFYNIYNTDFTKLNNLSYILYGVISIMILFAITMIVVPKLVYPRPTAATYGQALFRSNYLIFGAAVAESMYGNGNFGIVTLLGSVAVPIFNVQAAVLLETARNGSASPKKLLLAIVKNPTVIATALGLVINFSGIILPALVLDIVLDLAGLTTTLSFLSIGVSLRLGHVDKVKYLVSAVSFRLVIIPLIFILPAILLGFRGQELCALLILFAAPVAVSSYPMAVAMDADGELAAQLVAYSTLCCLPTVFLWTLALNSLGLL